MEATTESHPQEAKVDEANVEEDDGQHPQPIVESPTHKQGSRKEGWDDKAQPEDLSKRVTRSMTQRRQGIVEIDPDPDFRPQPVVRKQRNQRPSNLEVKEKSTLNMETSIPSGTVEPLMMIDNVTPQIRQLKREELLSVIGKELKESDRTIGSGRHVLFIVRVETFGRRADEWHVVEIDREVFFHRRRYQAMRQSRLVHVKFWVRNTETRTRRQCENTRTG